MILDNSIQVYLESCNTTDIKIKYDEELQKNDSKISSATLQVNKNNSKFKCYNKMFNKDRNKNNDILIECNPETKIIFNFANTKGSINLMVDSETNSGVREKIKNIINKDLTNSKTIIKNCSDIEINEINSNIDIKDSIGVNFCICTDNTHNKQINIKYESQQESKISKLFIGSFDKKSNSVDLYITKPNNTILHTNNDKINVICNDNNNNKLIHIQTLQDQIICKPSNCYLNNIIKDLSIILKPLIEELIRKDKKDYLKNLTEFIAATILENINKHIEIIRDKNEFNQQAITKCLQINKIQKTFAAILNFINNEIPKTILSKTTLENTRNLALNTIYNYKNSQPEQTKISQQNTESYMQKYLEPQSFLAPIKNLINVFRNHY